MKPHGARLFRNALASATFAALASGCVPLQHYQPPHGAAEPPALAGFARELDHPPVPAATAFSAEELDYLRRPFVIEFDDEGELWERPQWLAATGAAPASSTLSQFEHARAAIRLARAKDANLTVILFVHGWKHDANPEDIAANRGNFASFTTFITERNRELANRDASERPAICLGIFVAWRGTPWTAMRDQNSLALVPILNQVPLNLTLWNRLAAADRVARTSATQVMLTLASEAKRDDLGAARSHNPARVVIIGHSMGARIVEHSVAQAIVGSRLLNAPQALADSLSEQLLRCRAGLDAALAEYHTLSAAHLEQLTILQEKRGRLKTHGADLQAAVREEERAKASLTEALSNGWNAVTTWLGEKLAPLFAARPAPDRAKMDEALTADIATLDAAIAKREAAVTDENEDPALQLELYRAKTELLAARASMALSRETAARARATLTARENERDNIAQDIAVAEDEVKTIAGKMAAVVQHEADLGLDYERLKRRRDAALARPADLILLFNPASEALVTRQIADALNAPWFQGQKAQDQLPWIVSVTSDADWPTRVLYPAGAFLHGLFRQYRSDNRQSAYFQKPAPHIKEFCNYELTFVQSLRRRGLDEEAKEPWIDLNLSGRALDTWLQTHPELSSAPTAITPGKPKAAPNPRPERRLDPERDKDLVVSPSGIYTLKRRDPNPENSHPGYWVIKADNGLIRDHNDEFSPRAHALVSALLRISNTLPGITNPSTSDAAAKLQVTEAAQRK